MKYIFAFFSKMYRKYCLRDNFWRSKFLKCTFANTLISRLFFAKFLYFHIFPFFFHILECEAFQIFCSVLNFQTLEMFLVFPAFPFFLRKKRRKFMGKLLDKNGPFLDCVGLLLFPWFLSSEWPRVMKVEDHATHSTHCRTARILIMV